MRILAITNKTFLTFNF